MYAGLEFIFICASGICQEVAFAVLLQVLVVNKYLYFIYEPLPY